MATPASEIEMQVIEPDKLPPAQPPEFVNPPSAAPSASPSGQNRFIDRNVEHNLKYLNVICKLGILPFEVDVENQCVTPTKSSIRWTWFYFICFTCLLKVSYVNVTFMASMLEPAWMQVLHLPLHLAYAVSSSTYLIYLFLRPKVLRVSTVVLNAALAKRDRVKLFSRQQLILAIVPIGITAFVTLISFGFPFLTTIVYQFGTLLRVASTTESDPQSTMVHSSLRVAAYALDALPTFWILIGANYMLISHLVILEVLHSWCDDLRVKTNRLLDEWYGELVDIQIIIGIFNQIYGQVIFLEKAGCFSIGILALATVFWYGFSGNLVMGAVNLYAGAIALMLYPLVFEKAALISGSMEMAKKSLLMATADLDDQEERAFWRRRVKSIRIISIMCGPRPIERESLPLFYEFFVSNFISVLLTT